MISKRPRRCHPEAAFWLRDLSFFISKLRDRSLRFIPAHQTLFRPAFPTTPVRTPLTVESARSLRAIPKNPSTAHCAVQNADARSPKLCLKSDSTYRSGRRPDIRQRRTPGVLEKK